MSEPSVPSFDGNMNFNAHHAPMGAFMSFTCGHFGSGGGIGVELGKPANQNIYVGIKNGNRRASARLKCLPFLRGAGAFTSAAANFQVDHEPPASSPVDVYSAQQIRRHFGWASDAWVTPDFSFTIYTPLGPIPEPGTDQAALRASLLPAVIATLKVDNRAGTETKTAVFALDFPESGTRLLRGTSIEKAAATRPTRLGFAWRRRMGVLGMIEEAEGDSPDGFFAFQRWSVAEGVADANPVHALGSCGGLAVEVPPGCVRTLVLAIGVYLDGIVTTGLEGRYFYTRFYSALEEVLGVALERSAALRNSAVRLDAKLLTCGLSRDQQFLIAHGTRGYYASTQLLDIGGAPFYVVNEGEYCMMNTLDLAIDHAFWELEHNPWVVRTILDSFARHYSYHDPVRSRTGQTLPGGVSFCHDMGVHNNFSRPGHSSYELPQLVGCFSYMTQEQLCNWVLLAACYVAATNDIKWLQENTPLLHACAQSLRARAHPRTGVMAYDAARCAGGQEITTYDSLDESLGQARGNTYLAAKCWATWIALEMLAELRSAAAGAEDAEPLESLSAKLARHLAACAGPDGTIPAVLEKDNPGYHSRILPIVEPLMYPLYWLDCLRRRVGADTAAAQLVAAALRGAFIDALRRHTLELLTDAQQRNVFPDHGLKLSSTSNNSWMSKIALFQHVARRVLRLEEHDARVKAIFAAADAAHVRWQTDGAGLWACSDQFVKGVVKASRYYPRLITSALWMDQSPRNLPAEERQHIPPAVTTTRP